MIAAVLTQPVARSVVGSVGSTQHNMNCDRGFPQTILRYDGWTRSTNLARLWLYATVPLRALKLMAGAGYPNILVLEYAQGGDAHIETLARIARPDLAVVTTIGPAHMNNLKKGGAVAEQKGTPNRAEHPGGWGIVG